MLSGYLLLAKLRICIIYSLIYIGCIIISGHYSQIFEAKSNPMSLIIKDSEWVVKLLY